MMSTFVFESPLRNDDFGRNSDIIEKLNSSTGLDSDKISKILEEISTFSKKEILKVKSNLDVIYGSYSDEKKNRLNQLQEHLMIHLSTFFGEVVMESAKDKRNIIKEIEDLLAEKETLEAELQMKILIDERNDTTPLIDVQISIDKVLQRCRSIKEERMIELRSLQNGEMQMCMLLNEKPKYSKITSIPSATQLETLKHHLVNLKNIQITRRATFLEGKTKTESLFVALGEVPILQFDKMVLGNPDQFQLSKSNLDDLKKLIKRLENQAENQQSMAVELRSKLNSLWDRLLIDVTHREKFVNNIKGFSKSVINELKMEVERCETLKRDNIKVFIKKLRDELDDLWNKCHFGERRRRQCRVYYNNDCNEDVMDLLDIEVDNVKKFYNDNIDIYRLIEEREYFWNKMMMIKEQATDPARLWHNRGGQLLKEEKERKLIQKELPRVERELKALLQIYEKKEGKLFMYDDERLVNEMERQWNEFKSSKKTAVPAKPRIQSRMNCQTSQTLTRSNKGKVATTSSNQASKNTPRRHLTYETSKVAPLVPLNSAKLIGVNPIASKHLSPFHGSDDENASVESFQEHLVTKKQTFTSPTAKMVLREQNICVGIMPRKILLKTPTKGSQIPVPSTPKTPICTTPRTTPNTRTVTKLTSTMNKKLPIIF